MEKVKTQSTKQLQGSLQNGLQGELAVPGDKSISHRGIMFGAISEGTTILHHFLTAEDCLSTLKAFQQLGVPITRDGDTVTIQGVGLHGLHQAEQPLDMGNSGTTTRLIMGLLAGQNFPSELTGDASLSRRPMRRVSEPLAEMGANIEVTDGHLPAVINGEQLHGVDYHLKVASAQVKSALILAALQADGISILVEKQPTRNHTEKMLRAFGAEIETESDDVTITVYPEPHMKGITLNVPGDMSSAAFFMVAASLVPGSKVTLRNVGMNDTRTGLYSILKRMGGRISLSNEQSTGEPTADLTVEAAELKPIEIGADEIPAVIDELPLVALLAAKANGISKITGAGELRVKETDRISAIVTEFRKLGIDIQELDDGFIIDGRKPWQVLDSKLDSHGDHRIGMVMAVAALLVDQPLTLTGADSINISYPEFFDDLATLIER
ncbi:3-phosphoshikimate 1-carboxyvinyltransferase [Lentilactobacillus buchneri]|uniref:3-phosphoshikimate 1-carboxyvinyltransferase n=1 Tax=Lentilactobacillus buchneri subsp. silagei CD034 TaxID=1071400 RepID=J9W317_LENBU|nr:MULTISPECIES: 3-phosphoshikimate 1-carboxyvinyltransferase [Lentilactobacillus]MCC6100875.1 3-phosphoshikimate 1-carboxyvinyltransferase [Lactobacillus sp.]AFR99389.1 3-phosphoshikimate 1-carboxyvinyltransferase [Lentilactobacillus buchneri subsp. silagei CD034]MCT2900818.1 3-phosphoshikimate 1-carboxyvinyltransferase [Lentilactobacillus buchneri]MCT3542255.1 3-phosphoshikimate 1-carboxyvinyltransferase [Lentilactobacillus buchneri]MCT3546085.1 3-phosphoshikimate 1-carboxyvinyltransferase [